MKGLSTTAKGFGAFLSCLLLFILLIVFVYCVYKLSSRICVFGTYVFPRKKENVDIVASFIQMFGFVAAGLFFAYKLFTGWLIINLSLDVQATRQWRSDTEDWLVLKLSLDKGSTDTLWLQNAAFRVQELDASDNTNARDNTQKNVYILSANVVGTVPGEWPATHIYEAGTAEEAAAAEAVNVFNAAVKEAKKTKEAKEVKALEERAKEAKVKMKEAKRAAKAAKKPEPRWEKQVPDKRLTMSPGEKASFSRTLVVSKNAAYEIEAVVLGNRPFWRKRGMQWRTVVISLPRIETEIDSIAAKLAAEIAKHN